MNSDYNEYLDHCEDLANSFLCDTAETQDNPFWDDESIF